VRSMLTPRQQDLLKFIATYTRQRKGISPTYDEMRAGHHLESKSGIQRLLLGLEERGFIKRLPNRARAIEIVRQPQ
jgi:repressor LexA